MDGSVARVGAQGPRREPQSCGEVAFAADEIGVGECVELLRTSTVGRIGVSDRAIPLILPVHFGVYNDWVVIRTNVDSAMAAAAANNVVAFEADACDLAIHVGWSVIVVGNARLVERGHLHQTLCCLDLPAWSQQPDDGFIVIRMERISGRRVTFPVDSGTGIQT